jgi:hypothetical protein
MSTTCTSRPIDRSGAALGAMRYLRAKVGLCTAAGQIWSACDCTRAGVLAGGALRICRRSRHWNASGGRGVLVLNRGWAKHRSSRRRADCCSSGLDLFDQPSDESPVVFGSEMTPAGQGREEGLLGRGELPWLKEDPALRPAALRGRRGARLSSIARRKSGSSRGRTEWRARSPACPGRRACTRA